jgi:hypothetical protein
MGHTHVKSCLFVNDTVMVSITIAICIFTVFVAASAYAEQQQGQDIITIIPGASDKNSPAFFDGAPVVT